jgi:hypothetical protein
MKMTAKHPKLAISLLISLVVVLGGLPAAAQGESIILNNNRGIENNIWQIQGERTLVINGFDLTTSTLSLPVLIENISIDIFEPLPITDANARVDVVVYGDADGGSPINAQLLETQQVVFRQAGINTVQFAEPVVVNTPVVWIGFYMPVGTEFRSDGQGPSVLTYWAWTPGTEFNIRDLSSAQLFGPSDGSEPLNFNINGVARITATARSGFAERIEENSFLNEDNDTAIQEPQAQSTDVLRNYGQCPDLFFDTADVSISLRSSVSPTCTTVESWNAPPSPAGYTRRGDPFSIYDLTFYDANGVAIAGRVLVEVSHCFPASEADRPRGVIGVASGSPRTWEFLPSAAIGNLVCAEVDRGGNIALFVRELSAEEIQATANAAAQPTATPEGEGS